MKKRLVLAFTILTMFLVACDIASIPQTNDLTTVSQITDLHLTTTSVIDIILSESEDVTSDQESLSTHSPQKELPKVVFWIVHYLVYDNVNDDICEGYFIDNKGNIRYFDGAFIFYAEQTDYNHYYPDGIQGLNIDDYEIVGKINIGKLSEYYEFFSNDNHNLLGFNAQIPEIYSGISLYGMDNSYNPIRISEYYSDYIDSKNKIIPNSEFNPIKMSPENQELLKVIDIFAQNINYSNQ